MSSLVVKQLIEKRLDSVKDAFKDKSDSKEGPESQTKSSEQEDYERELADRHARHEKVEAEREERRQRIRDKYGIPKREYTTEDADKGNPYGDPPKSYGGVKPDKGPRKTKKCSIQ